MVGASSNTISTWLLTSIDVFQWSARSSSAVLAKAERGSCRLAMLLTKQVVVGLRVEPNGRESAQKIGASISIVAGHWVTS